MTSDGANYTWQVKAANQDVEVQLAFLADNLAIIRIEQAVLIKGLQLQIGHFSILKNSEIETLTVNSELTELTQDFYFDQLTKRGMMIDGKFVRTHPDFIQNSPITLVVEGFKQK